MFVEKNEHYKVIILKENKIPLRGYKDAFSVSIPLLKAFMKKLPLLVIVYMGIFPASAQPSSTQPVCRDLKEKLISIRQSFDKFPGIFIIKESGSSNYPVTASSDFTICGKKGILVKDSVAATGKFRFSLNFEFENQEYPIEQTGFKRWQQDILDTLREVFSAWKYEYDSEENGSMVYHIFSETKKNDPGIIKKIQLDIFDRGDNSSFTLRFLVYNYQVVISAAFFLRK